MKGRFCMIRIKVPEKAKNAVVLIKRTSAFFICKAKNGEIDNILSNRRNFYPGLGKELTALASLRKNEGILFFTKGVAPDNGAAPFTCSTKNKRFRRKKGTAFCNNPVQPEIFRLGYRTP